MAVKRAPAKGPVGRCWGVRGSIPAPGGSTAKYGGNTPCVEVRCGDDRLIFDLGTGARALGEDNAGVPMSGHIFCTHYHYDHLQGLPFFAPVFDPASRFTILGPTRNGRTVKDVIAGQMQQPYFPVTAEMVFRAKLDYRPFAEGDRLPIGDAVVTALEVNHPGGNLSYRVDYRGKAVVFATDHEHGTDRDAKLEKFAQNADVIIYDAMYTEDEYRGKGGPPRIGWGHSTWQHAAKIAQASNVKKLMLYHHDPTRTDAALEAIVKQVRRLRPEAIAAREGQTIRL
jgi:phosphoribosyl 1,2-cyclic phosphodiesterase